VRALDVVRQIVDHPSNADRRAQAVLSAVRWQVRSRRSAEPIEVPMWGDQVLRCYPRSNSASNVIYFTREHDPAEMAVIRAIVRPGDEVVDAGANIGVYTLLLAHLAGPAGRVVAVEPGPLAATRLRENVARNRLDQVEVVEAAVGSEPGEGAISLDSDVSNTLVPEPGITRVATVPLVTLDSLAADPSFIKLDVEGYEMEALRGAPRLLGQRPALQVELTEHQLQRMGSSGEEIRQLLHSAGYRTGFPVMDRGRVRMLDDHDAPTHNLIAVDADRWDEMIEAL
jgi:FkbM family methyltransferase